MVDNILSEKVKLPWCEGSVNIVLSRDPDFNEIAELNDLIRMSGSRIVKQLSKKH